MTVGADDQGLAEFGIAPDGRILAPQDRDKDEDGDGIYGCVPNLTCVSATPTPSPSPSPSPSDDNPSIPLPSITLPGGGDGNGGGCTSGNCSGATSNGQTQEQQNEMTPSTTTSGGSGGRTVKKILKGYAYAVGGTFKKKALNPASDLQGTTSLATGFQGLSPLVFPVSPGDFPVIGAPSAAGGPKRGAIAARDLTGSVSAGGAGEKVERFGEKLGYTSFDKVPSVRDVSTDFEVTRAYWLSNLNGSAAVAEPDHLEDENRMNRIIDSTDTKVGVVLGTLGFLDNSVGTLAAEAHKMALLATIEHSTGQVAMQTSAADPATRLALRDMEDKVQECLAIAEKKTKAEEKIKGLVRKRVDESCPKECGDAPERYADKAFIDRSGKQKSGGGNIAYCRCCASRSFELNKMFEPDKNGEAGSHTKTAQSEAKESHSFMHMLVVGRGKADSEILEARIDDLRKVYGDVWLKRNSSAAGGATDDTKGVYTRVYQMPQFSPQELANAFMNRCNFDEDGQNRWLGPGSGCPEASEFIGYKYGWCPAVYKLLQQFDSLLAGKPIEQYDQLAFELFNVNYMSARVFSDLLALNGDWVARADDQTSRERFLKQLQFLCESAGFAGVARLHSLMTAWINDHAVVSKTLTPEEINEVMQLVGRVGGLISLAQADADAKYKMQSGFTDVVMLGDRRKAANIASVYQALQFRAEKSAMDSALTKFSDSMRFCTGGDCG